MPNRIARGLHERRHPEEFVHRVTVGAVPDRNPGSSSFAASFSTSERRRSMAAVAA
jgi:hypothetical protein